MGIVNKHSEDSSRQLKTSGICLLQKTRKAHHFLRCHYRHPTALRWQETLLVTVAVVFLVPTVEVPFCFYNTTILATVYFDKEACEFFCALQMRMIQTVLHQKSATRT